MLLGTYYLNIATTATWINYDTNYNKHNKVNCGLILELGGNAFSGNCCYCFIKCVNPE